MLGEINCERQMAGSFLKLRLLAWINWISVDWNEHQAENAIAENKFFSFSSQSALAGHCWVLRTYGASSQ